MLHKSTVKPLIHFGDKNEVGHNVSVVEYCEVYQGNLMHANHCDQALISPVALKQSLEGFGLCTCRLNA